ncbi:MAG: haloacid dehalogenase, partial [Deltaproteobacteria bacterium]
ENEFNFLDPILPSEIGFDIDGVVADTMKAFIRVARDEFGINYISKEQITSYWIEECLPVPLDIIKTIINRLLADPFGMELEPLPGARDVLIRLAAHDGRLTFVTSRPTKEPIEAWLVSLLSDVPRRDIRVIATGHHSAKAGQLEELKLKYFIDDHLETCQDLHKRGIRTIVFDQPWNRGHTPFLRISSWKDLSSIIKMPS